MAWKRPVSLLQANKYIEETQPFKLVKTDPDAVARILYHCSSPAAGMPGSSRRSCGVSRKIFEQLGLERTPN